ncbi:LacI family DNA-binding transcriptional regulator [Leifsonia sp. C5G2]|uniref:LacI family DNA-binding transcriptional regulator n=1 Tax=Leifsonia sp. C5G2 TaxID=2735269 RepID=UPI0015856282|nr:LacI family DNA-binding transcriptional regulator [Leifsonia sp. C5G2]NUU05163.1 LacI family DNA-binding transcriptional regulator [Leifsonia sp. C5G2]
MGRGGLTGGAAGPGSGSGPGSGPAADSSPPPGERPVTIADVAARARVSKSAVSFVFNGRRGLSAATQARIVRAAEDLGWTPNARARALARKRPRSVGLVIRLDGPAPGPWTDVVGFLERLGGALASGGTALVVRAVSSAFDEEEAYAVFAGESQVDVVLVGALGTGDGVPALLIRSGLPFVAAPAPAAAAVADRKERARLAARHLAALGHRRVALVATELALLDAFGDEARLFGVEVVPRPLPNPSPVAAEEATAALVAGSSPPTAIVYETALLAAAGLRTTAALGLSVPTKLSVVGLDDDPVAASTTPALTTVRRDEAAWGRACARLLLASIDGGRSGMPAPPRAELVVRGSTCPPPPPPRQERTP